MNLQCFGRAIEVAPDTDHSKYMYMGQLMTGADAIAYFEKGIEIMKTKLKVCCYMDLLSLSFVAS